MIDLSGIVSTGGPLAMLLGVFVWLIQAVATGKLVSGAEARRLADRDERTIDAQRQQIQSLIEALRLPLAVVESLPRATGDPSALDPPAADPPPAPEEGRGS